MVIDVALVWIAAAAAVVFLAIEMMARRDPADTDPDSASLPGSGDRRRQFVDHDTPRWMAGYGQVFVGREQLPTFDHVSGMESLQRQLRDLAEPVLCQRPYGDWDRSPAVLLWGSRGAGKTLLASALAGHYQARLIHFSARFLIPRRGGTMQPHIAMVVRYAQQHSPSVLFIDDLELIAGPSTSRSAQATGHDLLNELRRRDAHAPCLVIAALTTDGAFVASRTLTDVFRPIIHIEAPDTATRLALLERLLEAQGMPFDNLDQVADLAAGTTPAQLIDLTHRACSRAQIDQGPRAMVEYRHFLAALVEPASPRWVYELALERGLKAQVLQLEKVLTDRRASVGLLFAGDAGTGKATIARCLAASTRRHLVTVTPDDTPVDSAALIETFRQRVDEACRERPSVLLLSDPRLLNPPTLRLVNADGAVGPRVATVVAEIDRALATPGVAVMATARQSGDVSPALRHLHRLGREIWVPYPDRYARVKLLARHLRGVPVRNVSPVTVADQLRGLTPAEIQVVVADAIRSAERNLVPAGPRLCLDEPVITATDIWRALQLLPDRRAWSLSS